MLEIRDLHSNYGPASIIEGLDLDLGGGEVLAVLGRNGMGKTTMVRSIAGMRPPEVRSGSIKLDGTEISTSESYEVARMGVGLVPQGRHVFGSLTVVENLTTTARPANNGAEPWTVDRVFEFFPRLAERSTLRARFLSGGEQQMLAIGRALMTSPKLLILDEATEGLAPMIRDEIWACLQDLKAEGQSILVIDKNVDALARIGDAHFIMEKGRVVWSGDSATLQADAEVKHRFLGI